MIKYLCIHGHFYQPPRIDPWLEDVPPEGSAAPEHDWNARISRECYTPLAYARRLDHDGNIRELINCYAWISFNLGPTLLGWMERHVPQTYARILAADKESLARLGHGNALAQVYHHSIMPLATDMDRELEIAWAIQDFQARFGRMPEGMWLAETAVDIPTLTALSNAGIRFTILAPRQAKAVRLAGTDEKYDVAANTLDTTRPYVVKLPAGQTITVFFYHGPTSQAVAFERLLENGENFWSRLNGSFSSGLQNIATDGESYGHHFMFGEMALAYVIEQARAKRDGLCLTNYAAYLAAHPAVDEVEIHENSSWSCEHGVERWKTHCGCTDGGHPDWIQDWRRPLRRSLNYVKYYVDEHFFKAAPKVFTGPKTALTHYGRVLAGAQSLPAFLDEHAVPDLTPEQRQHACQLVLMQRFALASFASCAWFFDDIARLEPLNGLTFARRAMDLMRTSGGPDIEEGFLRILEEAHSNMHEHWDGAYLWHNLVTPRRPNLAELCAYIAEAEGEFSWPGLKLSTQMQNGQRVAHALWERTSHEELSPVPDKPVLLSARHRAEQGFQRSRAMEENMLATACQHGAELLPLIQDFTEGQTQPHAFAHTAILGLAWNWLTEAHDLPENLRNFCQAWLQRNPDMRGVVERHAAHMAAERAEQLAAHEIRLCELVRRAHALGLHVSWWAVQNALIALNQPGAHPLLRQLVGVAQMA
ncbi:MAG: DUF3536 domain-containing protein [Desulfovibrionales bacterium]|nr:DUF3536 domain-containing protein [Desulfovibrionales bacterium]